MKIGARQLNAVVGIEIKLKRSVSAKDICILRSHRRAGAAVVVAISVERKASAHRRNVVVLAKRAIWHAGAETRGVRHRRRDVDIRAKVARAIGEETEHVLLCVDGSDDEKEKRHQAAHCSNV